MRAVITGIGSVTSLGSTSSSLWTSLLEGRSGITTDHSYSPRRLSAIPKSFLQEISENTETPGLQYAYLAGSEALSSSKIDSSEVSLILETCASATLDCAFSKSLRSMLRVSNTESKVSPLGSLDGVCSAFAKISSGLSEKVLLVGVSHSVHSYFYDKLLPLGILNTVDLGNPHGSVKSFDKNCRGTVLAEGATAILIEREESAQKRGAQVFASVEAFKRTSDGKHLLRPDEKAEGLIKTIQSCLSGLSDVDFAVLDGSGMIEKDFSEVLAVSSLFQNCRVSSIQSFTGHLLGALGATQLAAGVLSLSNVRFRQNRTFGLKNLFQPLEFERVKFESKPKLGISKVLVAGCYLGGGNYSVLLGK